MTRRTIIFGEPSFDHREEELLMQTIRSGWIGQGPLVQQFEQKLCEYLDVPHAIAVSSCTAALHLALVAAGVGPGDEVITTPFTFVATVNAIEHAGATPVLVDVDRESLNLTPEAVRAAITPRTRAVMPVHFAGRPLDVAGFSELADEHNLWLVEDGAHAIGAVVDGKRVGHTLSDRAMVCFSFYPNKNLSTSEGGAVTTRNDELADRLGKLRLHGLDNDAWKRFRTDTYAPSLAVYAGYKYNWTDIQAAMALPQLEKLEGFLSRREEIAARYDRLLADVDGVQVVEREAPSARERHALHLYQVAVEGNRDEIIGALRADGIGAAVHYIAVNQHPYYADRFTQEFPVSDWASTALITLPLHPRMADDDVDYVVERLAAIVAEQAVPAGAARA